MLVSQKSFGVKGAKKKLFYHPRKQVLEYFFILNTLIEASVENTTLTDLMPSKILFISFFLKKKE